MSLRTGSAWLLESNVGRAHRCDTHLTVKLRPKHAAPSITRCSASSDSGQPGSSSSPPQQQQPQQASASADAEAITKAAAAVLPKSGYFSLADPNQEVYSRAGEKFDPNKRGGRYKPEFIWNTDWQKALEMEESLQRRRDKALQEAQDGTRNSSSEPVSVTKGSGAVSFSRLAELNSMDVDLSEVLRKKPVQPKPAQEQAVAAPKAPRQAETVRTVPLPRNDVKRLARSGRIAKQMVVTVQSTKPEDEALKAQIAAQELERYNNEKAEQCAWAAAFAAVGSASTYAIYGREVCISYVLGAIGGLLYLRLLGRSVDSYGGQGVVAGAASAVGNQRLLIPVILALGYNRWNTLYAEDYGVHLNLLAILVGFLTYKVAIITRQGKQVMDEISSQRK